MCHRGNTARAGNVCDRLLEMERKVIRAEGGSIPTRNTTSEHEYREGGTVFFMLCAVDLSVSMQTHVFALSDCSRVGSNDGRRHAEGTFHAGRAEGLGTWHEHAKFGPLWFGWH